MRLEGVQETGMMFHMRRQIQEEFTGNIMDTSDWDGIISNIASVTKQR